MSSPDFDETLSSDSDEKPVISFLISNKKKRLHAIFLLH